MTKKEENCGKIALIVVFWLITPCGVLGLCHH